MRFEISNVGPLRHAAVELRPLTILIGPNNTGKSFLATVIYSALSRSGSASGWSLAWPVRSVSFLARAAARAATPLEERDSAELHDWLAEALDTGKPPAYEDVPQPVRSYLATSLPEALRAYGQMFCHREIPEVALAQRSALRPALLPATGRRRPAARRRA
jgi:hypothetical protein